MKMTRAILDAILTTLVDTGAPFDPAGTWIGVATAVVDKGDLTALTDVTPAPGDLATRVPITAWSDPYRMIDGRWVVDGPIATFVPASADDACTLTHWYLASALTAGTLKAFGQLTPNLIMEDEHNMASVVARISVDPDGRWDVTESWNG